MHWRLDVFMSACTVRALMPVKLCMMPHTPSDAFARQDFFPLIAHAQVRGSRISLSSNSTAAASRRCVTWAHPSHASLCYGSLAVISTSSMASAHSPRSRYGLPSRVLCSGWFALRRLEQLAVMHAHVHGFVTCEEELCSLLRPLLCYNPCQNVISSSLHASACMLRICELSECIRQKIPKNMNCWHKGNNVHACFTAA
jgi:hypothetical protein